MSRFSSLGLAAALFAAGCSGPSLEVLERHPREGTSGEFLSRRGTQLYLDDKPFRFFSFDAFTLTGCGGEGEVPTDQQLDAFLASLRARSLVRTLAFEPQGMDGIARVVAAAKARGQLLVLVLTDHDAHCAEVLKSVDWYKTGFRDSYLPWVRQVVARFKDDAAVGMWEVIKAPHDVDAQTLRNFYDAVGGEIHSIDPNHLVESGTHGAWAYGGDSGYELIHASPGIDVASFHDYDTTQSEPPNLAASVRVGAGLAKPVMLGEAGMFASLDGDPALKMSGMTCLSWAGRSDLLALWAQASFTAGLSGMDIWNWSPLAQVHASECRYETGSSDPLLELVHDFPIP